MLENLLLFTRASDSKLCTLKEYRDAMPEAQKYIYYAAGESEQKLNLLTQAEAVRDKGFDMLCLTDDVDEFLMQILHAYDEKEFRSISGGDLGLETEEERKEHNEKAESNKPMFDFMKEALGGKVSEVVLSNKLKSHPVCLSSKGAVSIEMEKVLVFQGDLRLDVVSIKPKSPLSLRTGDFFIHLVFTVSGRLRLLRGRR